MRTNLKMLRIKNGNLSQNEAAERIGVTRATYQAIEAGSRYGNFSVWENIQKVFHVPDSEMWSLMKVDAE